MLRLHLSLPATCAVFLLLCSQNGAAEESGGAATDGRALFMTYQCWQCHGYEAQGGAAPRLAAKQYPYEAFARFLRHPNQMPAYPPALLSDAELRRIFDFVRSIPEPPPLQDIPALLESKQ